MSMRQLPQLSELPRSLKIVNPPEGHNSYIGRKHALRLLKQGRGRLEDSNASIRFCEASQQVLAAMNTALWCERQRKRLAAIQQERGYDRVNRTIRRDELPNIPFVGEIDRLLIDQSRSPHRIPRGKNGRVKVILSSI